MSRPRTRPPHCPANCMSFPALRKSSTDATLKSLGGELATKAKSLEASLAGSPETQSQLTGALQSLLGNKGPEAVRRISETFRRQTHAGSNEAGQGLWPRGQARIWCRKIWARWMVRNQTWHRSSVRCARATSPRRSRPSRKFHKMPMLTPEQKDLLTSMAEKLAPGMGKAGETISGGLKSIPGFGH